MNVDPSSSNIWFVAETTLEEKTAVTVWTVVRYQRSLDARNQTLTVVELKPKTGRYHQLRRQMAWMYDCPILGDRIYGRVHDHAKRWPRGLMLCSNRVKFDHPMVSKHGWSDTFETTLTRGEPLLEKQNTIDTQERKLMNETISASVELPTKFEKFLMSEEINWKQREKRRRKK